MNTIAELQGTAVLIRHLAVAQLLLAATLLFLLDSLTPLEMGGRIPSLQSGQECCHRTLLDIPQNYCPPHTHCCKKRWS